MLVQLAAGNDKDGDKDKDPKGGRGFDITDSRIKDRDDRDRVDIAHGRGPHKSNKKLGPIKLDWNYDVAGPVNGGPAKWNFNYGAPTTGDNSNDRLYVAVNAAAGGATPRTKVFAFHSEVTELTSTDVRALEANADLAVASAATAVPANSTGTQVTTFTWITSRGNPGPVTIASGAAWTFTLSAKSSANSVNKLFVKVFTKNTSGALTQVLVSNQTGLITNARATYNITGTFASAVTLGATDRLAFQVFATAVNSSKTVTLYFEDTTVSPAASYVTTTIPASNVYAFSDIYNTVGSPNQQPFCIWQKAIGNGTGRVDGASATLNFNGDHIFLGCTDGKVYCLNTADGSTLWTYDTASSIVNSTAFFDAGAGSLSFITDDDLIWIGSTDGRLHKINANTGVGQKTIAPVSSFGAFAIHSTPIRYPFSGPDVVLVGADDGFVWRVDPNAIDLLVADSNGNLDYNLTRSGSITAADAIWGTPIFDVSANLMVLAVNGAFYKLNIITGAKSTDALFSAGSIMYSSPMIDFNNNFAYVGGGLQLWKEDYIGWVATFFGTTAGINLDNTYPRSSPLWVATDTTSYMYIGDGGGFMNRFDANSAFLNPPTFSRLSLQLLPSTTDSDSPVIMDFFTGNIYFGATNGRVYQLSQSLLQ